MDLAASNSTTALSFPGNTQPKDTDSRSDRATQIVTTVLPAAVQAGLVIGELIPALTEIDTEHYRYRIRWAAPNF